MAKRRIKNESFENLHNVVNNELDIDTETALTPVESDAYIQHEKVEEHVEEVKQELDKKAEDVKGEDKAEKPEPKDVEAKLVLDEDLEDFEIPWDSLNPEIEVDPKDKKRRTMTEREPHLSDEDLADFDLTPEDRERMRKTWDGRDGVDPDVTDNFLTYDMFNFIYDMFAAQGDKRFEPKVPKCAQREDGKKVSRFLAGPSDRYITYAGEDSGQDNYIDNYRITSSLNGDNIILYSNTLDEFDWVKKTCDYFKLRYKIGTRIRNSNRWLYSLTIYVPCEASGYPYLMDEYLEKIGLDYHDFMPNDYIKEHDKAVEDRKKSHAKMENDLRVDKMIKKMIVKAAQNGDQPLKVFLDELFVNLNAAGLTYGKGKVRKQFMDAFDD